MFLVLPHHGTNLREPLSFVNDQPIGDVLGTWSQWWCCRNTTKDTGGRVVQVCHGDDQVPDRYLGIQVTGELSSVMAKGVEIKLPKCWSKLA